MPIYWVEDPTAPFQPSPTRSRASLIVLSEVLSANDLGSLIGMTPDESWERGDKPGPRGRFSGISFTSRLAPGAPPGDHLSDLLSRVSGFADQIRALAGDERVLGPRLWLFHHIPNENPGLHLSPEHLSALDRLSTGLEIDIYVTGELPAADELAD